MKIELEIPDELIEEGRAIHIMAGMERIAYKLSWENHWKVKVTRCNSCGLCCKKLQCEFLNTNNQCSAPIDRPFVCCITEPRDLTFCTSRYKEV